MSNGEFEGIGEAFDAVVDDLQLRAPPPTQSTAARRRARGRPAALPTMQLVERDGIIFVEEGGGRGMPSRRRRSRAVVGGGNVLREIPLARLGKNQIGAALEKLDRKLNDNLDPERLQKPIVRELRDRGLVPFSGVPKGKTLLLVHGTFSHCDNLIAELEATDHGKDFLRSALDKNNYEHVLTFDHPTLTVSPIINARELGLRLPGDHNEIDVVCHSRGGLVTRWWLEGFDRAAPAQRRAVFVGSPLAGTGLAAPPNIRATLSLLANVANALGKVTGKAAAAAPFLSVVSGLFQIVSSITKLVAKTPAVDAAIALVPGLSAMSRVGNNPELSSLRQQAPSISNRYFVVQSDFQSDAAGWRFWRHFRKLSLADRAADAIFDGANDLVVDTPSMRDFSIGRDVMAKSHILDFGSQSEVHHINYFRQAETIAFIRERLSMK